MIPQWLKLDSCDKYEVYEESELPWLANNLCLNQNWITPVVLQDHKLMEMLLEDLKRMNLGVVQTFFGTEVVVIRRP